MRLTIIPIDSAVYIDGVCKMPLDLSGCGIPLDIHALQWFEQKGWIEFSDDNDPFTPKPPNQTIESLPDWAITCVAVWESYIEEHMQTTIEEPAQLST